MTNEKRQDNETHKNYQDAGSGRCGGNDAANSTIMADTRTNGGNAYLLDQSIDVSRDFSDFTNTYFFVDSLTSFDTKTGRGTAVWKRQQLMPRQAFNANTYLHQPLKSLDFPNTAYPQYP